MKNVYFAGSNVNKSMFLCHTLKSYFGMVLKDCKALSWDFSSFVMFTLDSLL